MTVDRRILFCSTFMAILAGGAWAQPWMATDITGNPALNRVKTQALAAEQPVSDRVFFEVAEGPYGGASLWCTDGTPAGTRALDLENLPPYSGEDYQAELIDGIPYVTQTRGCVGFWRVDSAAATGEFINLRDLGVIGSWGSTCFGGQGTFVLFKGVITSAYPAMDYIVFVSDGTREGTTPLVPAGSSEPFRSFANATEYHGEIFFTGLAADDTSALWRTDGTPEGTVIVYQPPGESISTPCAPFVDEVSDTMYFGVKEQGTNAFDLWMTNGTTAGTVKLTSFAAGDEGVGTFLGSLNGLLFFAATDAAAGRELWVSNGTSAGTGLFKDIKSGASSGMPTSLSSTRREAAVSGGKLFFPADDGVHGVECWSTDGTLDGTTMVADIMPGTGGGYVGYDYDRQMPIAVGDTILFEGYSGTASVELWVSDGTADGTKPLTAFDDGVSRGFDIIPNSADKAILLVHRTDDMPSDQVWITDGTDAGTSLLRNFTEIEARGYPRALAGFDDGSVFFIATNDDAWRLCYTKGTPETTTELLNPSEHFRAMLGCYTFNDRLFINGIGYSYVGVASLWTSDGTPEGTVELFPANSAGTVGVLNRSPRGWGTAGDRRIYEVLDEPNGQGLWATDGTPEGTQLLHVFGTTFSKTEFIGPVSYEGRMYFLADLYLWTTDGTPTGTYQVIDSVWSDDDDVLLRMGTKIFSIDPAGGKLAFYDMGTGATNIVENISPESAPSKLDDFFFVRDRCYFTATLPSGEVSQLWITDGTEAGTRMLSVNNLGLSVFSNPYAAGEKILFWRLDEAHGLAPWVSDGTPEGTFILVDPSPGPDLGHYPRLPIQFDNTGHAHFGIYTPETGWEPWSSDLTPEGTHLLKDIYPGPVSSNPVYLDPWNGYLHTEILFAATNPEDGTEYWSSDGTSEGTVLLKDVFPGLGSPLYDGRSNLSTTLHAGRLYTSLQDVEHGVELWRTDGTPAGTERLTDIAPGPANSYPDQLCVAGETLYFTARDGSEKGMQLWAIQLSGPAEGVAWQVY